MSGQESSLMERRVRHVAAIQVANLTPFPARDSLASALAQPSEQSQFTSHGHLSDDLDVTLQRKRSRRISGNSVATHRSIRSEDSLLEDGGTMVLPVRGRKKSAPRVSFPSEGTDDRHLSTAASAPTIRPRRPRTTSTASSLGSHISILGSGGGGDFSTLPSSFSAISPDYSQVGLERVIQSRLVETFLVVAALPDSDSNISPLNHILPSPGHPTTSQDRSSPSRLLEATSVHKLGKSSYPVPADKTTPTPRRGSNISPRASPRASSSQSPPTSATLPRINRKAKVVSLQHKYPPSDETQINNLLIPNYFSPIHRPSTHPYFAIDTDACEGFGEGHRLTVEIWGRVGTGWRGDGVGKGKEKSPVEPGAEWKVLQHWDVDLRDLVPLSEASATHEIHNSSNSLLITLSSSSQTFYLPQPSTPLRPLSPTGGYASDPESSFRKGNQLDLTSSSHNDTLPLRRRHRAGGGATPLASSEASTTANWQDLFRLATLQSCIMDNEVSLSNVVRGMDKALELDETLIQRHEVSEREARLEELTMMNQNVIEESTKLRNTIASRVEDLRRRKLLLQLAKEHHKGDVELEKETENLIGLDRDRHLFLRARLGPIRTSLFTNVFAIYPIELLSPPDLLYTVLDVPLPIPLSASDPAPPLTLPSHKDVTEDAVATSLGYAAQAVQLIAAYLGKSLVYPVTCIGSRSLIRDNISAMVGPRAFPLYSKGVDSYRFEYGVFLLNKDIELLMVDRELRALDMRHTLPNLKNLLLTLTDGEGADLRSRTPDSLMSLATEMQSPSRPESPVDPNSATPKGSSVIVLEEHSPPVSGSTTPTAATTDVAKKLRPFLGFSPLTDFWRGRNPSSSRVSIKSGPSLSEEESEERLATSVEGANPERDASTDNDTTGKVMPDLLAVSNGEGRKSDHPPPNGSGEKLNGGSSSSVNVSPPLPLTTSVR